MPGYEQHDPHAPAEAWIGYTAGLIDGKGAISSDVSRPRLTVSTSVEVAGKLIQLWGCGRGERHRTGFGESYKWVVSRRGEIVFVVEACLPFLVVNRNETEQIVGLLNTGRGRWTAREDQTLREMVDSHTDAEIALRLNRTVSAVQYRRLNLLKRRRQGAAS